MTGPASIAAVTPADGPDPAAANWATAGVGLTVPAEGRGHAVAFPAVHFLAGGCRDRPGHHGRYGRCLAVPVSDRTAVRGRDHAVPSHRLNTTSRSRATKPPPLFPNVFSYYTPYPDLNRWTNLSPCTSQPQSVYHERQCPILATFSAPAGEIKHDIVALGDDIGYYSEFCYLENS